tara:strand:+ start:1161 stop:1460 length:300 start_codon:yes stop_codon:yes gene_type:complete
MALAPSSAPSAQGRSKDELRGEQPRPQQRPRPLVGGGLSESSELLTAVREAMSSASWRWWSAAMRRVWPLPLLLLHAAVEGAAGCLDGGELGDGGEGGG